MLGAAGFVLDLHAQAADVHIHDLHIAEIILAPYAFQDLLPHQRCAGVAEEQLHDLELHLGQVDGRAVFVQHAALFVQHKGAADELLLLLGGFGGHAAPLDAAGQCFQPGHQLRHREGLGNVIVRTDGQPADLIALLPFGRHDNDADLVVLAADRLAQTQTVHSGQHNVQQGGVALLAMVHQFQGALCTGGLHDLPAGHFQVQGDHFADARFVFYDQNSFHSLSFLYAVPNSTVLLLI